MDLMIMAAGRREMRKNMIDRAFLFSTSSVKRPPIRSRSEGTAGALSLVAPLAVPFSFSFSFSSSSPVDSSWVWVFRDEDED